MGNSSSIQEPNRGMNPGSEKETREDTSLPPPKDVSVSFLQRSGVLVLEPNGIFSHRFSTPRSGNRKTLKTVAGKVRNTKLK